MSYVSHERIDLEISLSTGAPQTLTLELQNNREVVTLISLGDPRIELAGGKYRYSFVPTDADIGAWGYRWWGTDVGGIEFAWPSDLHWQPISIL